jgi:hypothetical protein
MKNSETLQNSLMLTCVEMKKRKGDDCHDQAGECCTAERRTQMKIRVRLASQISPQLLLRLSLLIFANKDRNWELITSHIKGEQAQSSEVGDASLEPVCWRCSHIVFEQSRRNCEGRTNINAGGTRREHK